MFTNLSLISHIRLLASAYPPAGSNMFLIVPLICATFLLTRYEKPSWLCKRIQSASSDEPVFGLSESINCGWPSSTEFIILSRLINVLLQALDAAVSLAFQYLRCLAYFESSYCQGCNCDSEGDPSRSRLSRGILVSDFGKEISTCMDVVWSFLKA